MKHYVGCVELREHDRVETWEPEDTGFNGRAVMVRRMDENIELAICAGCGVVYRPDGLVDHSRHVIVD